MNDHRHSPFEADNGKYPTILDSLSLTNIKSNDGPDIINKHDNNNNNTQDKCGSALARRERIIH
jgi:hypothetical protein